jgi:tellurium resistance protein TerZ
MITLQKEQKQSLLMLVKNAEELNTVIVGAGWDANTGWFGGGGSVDLDTSIICFDENKRKTDSYAYFGKKLCGNFLRHTGDDLSGDSSANSDDEQIVVSLNKVPSHIHYLVVTLNSFTGQEFGDVKNAYARVFTTKDNLEGASLTKKISTEKELVKVELKDLKNNTHKGAVLAVISRDGDSWSVKATVATHPNARTFEAMWDVAKEFI